MSSLKIEVPVSADVSRQSRHIWGTSRLEPWSATSGCSNTICCSWSPTSALTAMTQGSQTSCWAMRARWRVSLNLIWRHICPQEDTSCAEGCLCCCLLVDGRFNRWLIPSTIAGASQLFKTLLTWGDNPVKAVKDHVLRRRGRQLAHTEGLKGSVNVSTLSNQNDRAGLW